MRGAGDDGPPQDPHPSQALSGAAAPPRRVLPEAPAIATPPARRADQGRPWPRLALPFKDCLDRADHAGLCALVLEARPATMPNWAIGQFLRAALSARDEQALRRAVEMAVAAPLQPALRARLALALVRHRQAGLALDLLGGMLDAAPEPAVRPVLLTALAAITLDGTAPAEFRRLAAERRRALSGVAEGGFETAAVRPRRQAPSPSLAPRLGIAAAPGAGPGTAVALLAMLERRAAWDSAEQPRRAGAHLPRCLRQPARRDLEAGRDPPARAAADGAAAAGRSAGRRAAA